MTMAITTATSTATMPAPTALPENGYAVEVFLIGMAGQHDGEHGENGDRADIDHDLDDGKERKLQCCDKHRLRR